MEEEGQNEVRKRKFVKVERGDGPDRSYRSGRKHEMGSLPLAVGYGIIFAFVISLKLLSLFDNALPDQISIDEAGSYPGRFIGQRAELQLKRLTDLGTKVVGSYENEVLAVDLLKREISFIAQEAEKIHTLEVDIQKPTGSYFLSFKPYGFRNYYANIQNVVVKLSSSKSPTSILMNCHYDTVPESPGASDNGINCAVMLEVLRVLTMSKTPLKNNVIFLFNGAEENPLQASHGFLSQHKWSKEVKVVINLDSAGAGGKEILFQTSGDSWLVDAYARSVPRPTAGVQGEEIFQFGIIPSDTDFRIFRDFGGYAGFDFAHCTNGYIYHTKYDKMDYIHPGVYQHTGDNMLALVNELVQSPELERQHAKTRLVYTDVFGLFVISYSESFGIGLNLTTVLISLVAIYKSCYALPATENQSIKSLSTSTGGQLLGLLLAGAIVLFISKTLDIYKATMSWYLRPWLVIPLYALPIVFSMIAVLLMVQTQMKKDLPAHNVVLFVNGAQLLWTGVLILGTVASIRSAFIITLMVLPVSVGSLIATASKKNFTVKKYLLMCTSCLVLPTLFLLLQCVRIFTTIIPMAARMGPHKNPEIIIGGLTFLTATVSASYFVPLLLLLRKLRSFLLSLCVLHILSMTAVIGTKFGFPYNGDIQNPSLQRFYALHCERTFYDAKGAIRRSDSGIFLQSMDRNNFNYVKEIVSGLKAAHSSSDDCTTELYCGFPVFTSRFIAPAPHSYWVPAAPPTIHHPTSLEVVNQTQISVHVRKVRILITGPDHITVVISPRRNVRLLKWSFDEFEPKENQKWNDRETFMVYYSHGLMGGTLEFDVDLEINQEQADFLMDIAVVGHYMHDKKFRTDEFKKMISEFPEWAHVTAWTTTFKSWII